MDAFMKSLWNSWSTIPLSFNSSLPVGATLAVASALLLVFGNGLLRISHSRPPFPPGPKSKFHFLLGNLLDLPDTHQGLMDTKLLERSRLFGLYFTISIPLMGRIIVISDPKLMKHVTVTNSHRKADSYNVLVPVVGKRSMLI